MSERKNFLWESKGENELEKDLFDQKPILAGSSSPPENFTRNLTNNIKPYQYRNLIESEEFNLKKISVSGGLSVGEGLSFEKCIRGNLETNQIGLGLIEPLNNLTFTDNEINCLTINLNEINANINFIIDGETYPLSIVKALPSFMEYAKLWLKREEIKKKEKEIKEKK